MKTPSEIFKNHLDLLKEPSVKELVTEYEQVCDALIYLKQISEMSKEKYLLILVREIRESIAVELKQDLEAERFGESERVNFKNAVENLSNYITDYCRDHNIYLSIVFKLPYLCRIIFYNANNTNYQDFFF